MFFLFRNIIAIVFIVTFQSTAFSSDRVIKLASLNWGPYVEENLENYGFTSEIVSEVFKKAGYQVEIYFMPWARVLAEVKTGEYDAMYPAYYSEERSRTYALSNPIAQGLLVLYKRSCDTILYKTLMDLKPYKIGVVRGYVNTPEFDSAVYLNKKIVNNDKQNLLKLLTGRIDLAVIDKYTAKRIIKIDIPQAAGKLNFLDPPLDNKPLYVGFSKAIKDYPKLLKNFNQALNDMIKKGLIDNIVKKHGF
ncbi:MAG: transporter substrate-binding domain-containing protein [Desulfobacula sp.]|jgi:polar amino acid transport system substrate-binding protein|nr:transporter substrate-binding domain-containing protein [Desulfobacula sp.]